MFLYPPNIIESLNKRESHLTSIASVILIMVPILLVICVVYVLCTRRNQIDSTTSSESDDSETIVDETTL